MHAFALEPLTADFPFARSLLVVRSQRTIKRTGQTSCESRYYVSSRRPEEHTPTQWLGLIRGHWGGVEVRNHWKRDAVLGEDGSRSRNPNLLANVALLRSAVLAVLVACRPLVSRPTSHPRGGDPLPRAPAARERFKEHTTAERVNRLLQERSGRRWAWGRKGDGGV